MEKIIELRALADVGRGSAKITDTSVEIQVNGIIGGMKAWLIGGEAEAIGNLVDGKLKRQIDTTGHNGILITQTGRQLFMGLFGSNAEKNPLPQDTCPFNSNGFNWKKFTEKDYSNLSLTLRYILSNRSVYENYKKYGHYWIGEDSGNCAIALKYDGNENPLTHLQCSKTYDSGYIIATFLPTVENL